MSIVAKHRHQDIPLNPVSGEYPLQKQNHHPLFLTVFIVIITRNIANAKNNVIPIIGYAANSAMRFI